MKINDALLQAIYLILLGFVLVGSTTSLGQQKDPVQIWLMTDCTVGHQAQDRAALGSVGNQAIPQLINAAKNGPDPSLIATLQAAASIAYDQIGAALATGEINLNQR